MNRTIVLLALIVWPASWKSAAVLSHPPGQEEDFARRREAMVTRQIARRGLSPA